MSLDMWFRDDVVRILAAVASAGEQHSADYHRAIRDVALGFGLVLEQGSRVTPMDLALLEAEREAAIDKAKGE